MKGNRATYLTEQICASAFPPLPIIPPSLFPLQFNEGANNASCFQNLVQANVRNKNKLKADVNKITAKGITNYKAGFEMAFKQLAQVKCRRGNAWRTV